MKKIVPLLALVYSSIISEALFAQNSGIISGHLWGVTTKMSYPYLDTAIMATLSWGEQNDRDSAIQLLNILFERSVALDYDYGMANALLSTGGLLLLDKRDIQEGRRYLIKAYPYCKRAFGHVEELMVRWNNSMGASFSLHNRNDSALVYYYRALTLALKHDLNNKEYLAKTYNNLASTYADGMRQFKPALFHLNEARKIAEGQSTLVKELGRTYSIFALTFIHANELDSAKTYLNKANGIYDFLDRRARELLNYVSGHFYLTQGQVEKAIPFFEAGGQGSRNNKALNFMGVAMYQLHDFEKADHYFSLALKENRDKGVVNNLPLYINLAIANDSLKRYEKAYHYLLAAMSLKDSINLAEKQSDINQLEVSYRTASKDREITAKRLQLTLAENKLDKKNFQITLITAGSLILLLTGAFLFQIQRLKLQRAKTREQQQRVDQLKEIIEAEEKERSRIGRQLHDDVMVDYSIVKMNLAALSYQHPEMKTIADYQKIEQQLKQANQKLRQAAHNLMPDALLEEGLTYAVNCFCEGVQKTSGIQFNFTCNQVPRLSAEVEISLYRIIQELIQNVIKHADATMVDISLDFKGDALHMHVKDNGRGFQYPGWAENGMGLKSINTRLRTIKGDMKIDSVRPHGTSVYIEACVSLEE